MPEGTGDYIANIDLEFKEIINTDVGGSLAALNKFDTARQDVYDGLALLAADCIDQKQARAMDFDGVSERFGHLLPHLLNESEDTDDFVTTTVRIFIDDSNQRIGMIRSALDDESIKLMDSESLAKQFNAFILQSETTDDAVKMITAFYDNDLKADIDILVEGLFDKEHIDADEDDDYEGKTIKIEKEHLDHVVDVAKIVAGVTIALALDKLLRRNR